MPQILEADAVRLILQETPTLGVRTLAIERYVSDRESTEMTMELGSVSVKVKSLAGKPVSVSPEFEDCRRIALESGLTFQEVYQQAVEEARRRFLN